LISNGAHYVSKIGLLGQRLRDLPARRLKSKDTRRAKADVKALPIEQIIDGMHAVGVVVVNSDLSCIYASGGFAALAQQPETAQWYGEQWQSTIAPEDLKTVLRGLQKAIDTQSDTQGTCRLAERHRWVSWTARGIADTRKNAAGQIAFTDITDHRKASNSLLQLSLFDPLTHLPNRELLMQRLEKALSPKAEQARQLSLIFIDLDGFKLVNDTLGHSPGDQLILEVSRRLAQVIGPDDMLARLGSDEFTVLVDSTGKPGYTNELASDLLNAIKHPMAINDENIYMTASIGIAVSRSGVNADALVRQADVAMYNAKKSGSGQTRFYSPKLTATTERD